MDIQISKKSTVIAKETCAFKMECKQFLLSVTKKVLEKSSMKFPLVRGLSSLDSQQMCTKPGQCLAGLKNVLNALIVTERLSDYFRDTVLAEYVETLQMEKHKICLFEKSLDRPYIFFYLLKFNSSYSELWRVMELLLVLSRGQATAKRGFSVNKQVFVENLKSLPYIMQCNAMC